LSVVDLVERGEAQRAHAESLVAAVPAHVATRELAAVGHAFGWGAERLHARELPRHEGPGNALFITFEHAEITEVFSAFGERGVSAETVAQRAIDEARAWLASDAAVGCHLADRLLVPTALAGGGSYTTSELTPHTQTNAEVIAKFLPVKIGIARAAASYKVTVGS